jgi:molecular chaperone HscA
MFTVGIDLGTTNSVVAFIDKNGKACSIAIDCGGKTVPSVVNYAGIHPIVGREAMLKADSASVFSIKRHMGSNVRFFEKSPEEISADILAFIKKSAENQLGRVVDAAVITVPAHFSESQRMATKRAASIAGIKVLRLIGEPSAAAIAFGLDKHKNGIYAVYDFGGGTFDFSILRLSDGAFQVLATGGDNYLGGDDIDNDILKYNFDNNGLDFFNVSDGEKAIGKLLAKSMKELLADKDIIRKDFSYMNKSYDFFLSKDVLENILSKYIDRTFEIMEQVFCDANISHKNLDGIILVGGMTKITAITDKIKKRFGMTVFNDINPEEVVAFGAAIHADSVSSKSGKTLLIDVMPLSLGIETFGGSVDKIIHRNTPIPFTQTREYTTYADNQTGIKFRVVQGERALANDCRAIAEFDLAGIPKMPAGIPKIVVEFSVDVNGLLNVKAFEKNTKISQSVTVEPSSGLTDEKMIEILKTASKNRETDNEKSLHISIQIESERQMHFWESIVDEIPEKERALVIKNIENLKKALNDRKYQDVMNYRKDIESVAGQFLDKIICNKLNQKHIKISDLTK